VSEMVSLALRMDRHAVEMDTLVVQMDSLVPTDGQPWCPAPRTKPVEGSERMAAVC